MTNLSPGMKVTPAIRKEVEKLKKKTKEEVEQVKNLLNCFAHPDQAEVFKQPIFSF